MEIYNAIIQAISTVGFPIVCCLLMMKNNKEMRDANAKKEESLQRVIENNTLSITKLYAKIDTLIDTINKN